MLKICKKLIILKKKYLVEIDIVKILYFGIFKNKDYKKRIIKDVDVDILLISFILVILFDVYIELICMILRFLCLNMYFF